MACVPKEADLTHGLVLTALSVLESFGQRGQRSFPGVVFGCSRDFLG